MRIMTASLLIAMLAACGGSGGNSQGQTVNQAPAEPVGNRVAALSDGQRNGVFIRAIRDAGLDCQHVDGSAPAGSYRGMPVWRATCRGGGAWTIVIGDDGSAQILNADEARLVTDADAAAANGAR